MKNEKKKKKTKNLNIPMNKKLQNKSLTPKNVCEKKNFSPLIKEKNFSKLSQNNNQLIIFKSNEKKTTFIENEKNKLEKKKLKVHKTPLIWSKKPIFRNKKEDLIELNNNKLYMNTEINYHKRNIEIKETLTPTNYPKFINKSFSKEINKLNNNQKNKTISMKNDLICFHRKENSNIELSKFNKDHLKEKVKLRENSLRIKSTLIPISYNKELSKIKDNNHILSKFPNKHIINNINLNKPKTPKISTNSTNRKNDSKKNKINSPKKNETTNKHLNSNNLINKNNNNNNGNKNNNNNNDNNNLNNSVYTINNTIESVNLINYSISYSKIEDSDVFEYEKEKPKLLTKEEKLIYGNREPKGFKKIKLLGKGGCGIVWLMLDKNKNQFAIKQIPKKIKLNSQIAKREIEIINYIQKNSENESMVYLYNYIEDNNDIWIIYEKGGHNLSDLCLKIKGEFLGTERIYLIKKGHFLIKLTNDISQLKLFIRTMLKFIYNLSINNIVHGDIKPDNILIEYNKEDYSIRKIKVIDFGSAYFLNNPINFSSNTPEYISPEITELLELNNSSKDIILFLKKLINYSYCIDIWSLGVTIIEIITACPLWMSYKAKVIIRGKSIFKFGLFGVKGRDGGKIYHIQKDLNKKLKKIMKDSLINDINDRNCLEDLLCKMLIVDYKKRINPIDALKHPFLNEEKKEN